ncbi:uncharacterized protein MONBRDRAFT_32799, partial [Monosiga brevicollis MX1]
MGVWSWPRASVAVLLVVMRAACIEAAHSGDPTNAFCAQVRLHGVDAPMYAAKCREHAHFDRKAIANAAHADPTAPWQSVVQSHAQRTRRAQLHGDEDCEQATGCTVRRTANGSSVTVECYDNTYTNLEGLQSCNINASVDLTLRLYLVDCSNVGKYFDGAFLAANGLSSLTLGVQTTPLAQTILPALNSSLLHHLALYNATDDPDFTGLPVQSDLTTLELVNCGLTHVPTLLNYAPGLSVLNMSSNSILQLPPSLNDLVNLTVLLAAHNQITDLDNLNLPHLQTLDLGYNQLNADLGDTVHLPELQGLDLRGNLLSSVPPFVATLTRLTELILSNNNISTLSSDTWPAQAELTLLALDYNRIRYLEPGTFQRLTVLEHLDISSNAITALPAGLLSDLSSLTMLELQSNRIAAIDVHVFQDLTALTVLYAWQNQLSDLDPALLAPLSQLRILFLSTNRLRTLHPDTLAAQTRLEQLGLADCQLDALPENLVRSDRLQALYIRGSGVTALPHSLLFNTTSLQSLYAAENRLASLPDGAFRGYAQLLDLDLGNSLIADLEGQTIHLDLAASMSLQNLDLTGMRLNSVTFSQITELVNLTYLAMGGRATACRENVDWDHHFVSTRLLDFAITGTLCESISLNVSLSPVAKLRLHNNLQLRRLSLLLNSAQAIDLLDVSATPLLERIDPAVQVRTLNISLSGLPYDPLLCNWMGQYRLIARGLRNSSSYTVHARRLLQDCFRGTDYIDLSDNAFLSNLEVLRETISQPFITTTMYASPHLDGPSYQPVQVFVNPTFLALADLPVSCNMLVENQVIWNEVDNTYPLATVYRYECECASEHRQLGSNCYAISPIGDTQAGLAASFVFGVLFVLQLAVFARRYVRYVREYDQIRLALGEERSQRHWAKIKALIDKRRVSRTAFTPKLRVRDFDGSSLRGGFGAVVFKTFEEHEVAVKGAEVRFQGSSAMDNEQQQAFDTELDFLLVSSHENLVNCYAWGVLQDGAFRDSAVQRWFYYLVLEKMDGDLTAWLEQHPFQDVSDTQRINIALQVATGLEYIHGQQHVHQDIKQGNVLVKELPPGRLVAKVADFGSLTQRLRVGEDGQQDEANCQGTAEYLSPARMEGFPFAPCEPADDVYAYGVVLYGLVTHTETSLLELAEGPQVAGFPATKIKRTLPYVRQGYNYFSYLNTARMQTRLLRQLVKLGRQCLNLDAAQRPSFTEVKRILMQLTGVLD